MHLTVAPYCQVPFGPLAFMPGRLYHTNEILVLLGDNWFAERSAVQAKGIANRRMDCKSCMKLLSKLGTGLF